MKTEFGTNLKRIREDRGWTLEEMAEKLGSTKQVLSRYERGERTPKITMAARFAEILGVPLKELVGAETPDEFYNNELKKRIDSLNTIEARIISEGIDSMPEDKRKQALEILKTVFTEYADLFRKLDD